MKTNSKRGFTLLEAIVSMVLAASGMALVFQGIGGATKLQGAAQELNRTNTVAHNILITADPNIQNNSGITDGIAWTVTSSPIARNKSGAELIRIRVAASASSGRQVLLVTEAIRSP